MFGQSKAAALVAASSLLFVELACAGPGPMLSRQVETPPLDCTNLDTNGTIYKGSTESFEIFCGYDFPGGDYAAVQAETFEDCIKACEDDAACADVAYGFGTHGCYLKDSATTATVNGGVYAARKIPGADAPISCQTPGTNNTVYSKDTTSSFQILCDTDYSGEDLAAVQSESFADCIAACDANEDCVDVSYGYRTKSCYLKGKVTTPNALEGFWTALKKTEEQEGPNTAVTCEDNASNNTIYKTAGSSFLVLCGFDFGGGDMGGSPQSTFADCMDACAATQDCIDVSYAGGFCYMKNTLTTATPSPAGWVWTGKKVVATTDPEPTGPELTCVDGAMDGKTFTASSGNQYAIICGREYPGGDLKGVEAATFEDCVEACDTTPDCIDVSYVAPACYLKSSLTTLQDAGYVSTALFIGRPIDTVPVVPLSCVDGKDNGTTYATPAGNEYLVLCGVDYFGGDMGMVYTDTFEKCMDTCDSNDGCIDVAYSGTACYMKNEVTTHSPAAWAWNALYVGKVPVTSSTSYVTATSSTPPTATSSEEPTVTSTTASEESTITATTASEESTVASTASSEESTITSTASAEESSIATSASTEEASTTATVPIEESSTTTSGPSTVASETPCSTEPAGKFLPSQDIDIDRSAPERLAPSLHVELNYAEQPGNRILQMELVLSTPAVVLENIAPVTSVSCSEAGVLVTFSDVSHLNDAVAAWADSTPLLITYFEGCNLETARGFWGTTSHTFSTTPTPSILFSATQRNLTDVATEATLKYGTVDAGVESYTSTATGAATEPTAAAEQTCAASSTTDSSTTISATETSPASSETPDASSTSSATSETPNASSTSSATSEASATSTASGRPLPETLEDLTPAARELYDFLLANLPIDADGNLNYHVPAQKVTELEVAPFDRDDVGKQQELEDMFADSGVDSPADLVAKASSGVAGICQSPAAAVQRRLLQPSRRVQREIRARSQKRNYAGWVHSKLQARDSDGWDIACSDMVGGLLGLVGLDGAMETACNSKDLYDSRDAFKCLFGGCKTTTIVTTTSTYDFEYAWKIDFPSIQGWLTMTGPNKVLTCVNCGFSVSNIAFSGKIVVAITEGVITIKSANVTPGISGTANMIVRLQSDGAYSDHWDYTFNSVELGAIQMDSAFKISPTVHYGIGVDFSTDSALDVTGGATFSWNGAAAPINILSRSLGNQRNWQPSVSLTTPSFKTGASVSIKPYMRWLVKLNVDIYGMVKISPSITSQTVVGIVSTYSYTAANGCPANSLKVNTYLSTANAVSFGDGTGNSLYTGQTASVDQCFAVPGLLPSPEEIASLKAVGSEFCTAFLKYTPPRTVRSVTTTATVPSTTTVSTTETVTYTETLFLEVTETLDFWYSTTTVSATTVTVTAAPGSKPNFAYLNAKRDNNDEPTATPTTTDAPGGGGLDKRAVALPSMVAGWDATKISFACKQVATGTSTLVATATTTVTSGVVTSTATITVNKAGPLETEGWTNTYKRFMGQVTETAEGTATQTVCPTPVATPCFKLKVHGAWWLEGKYLRYSEYCAVQADLIDAPYDVFYSTASGHLMGYTASGDSCVMSVYYWYRPVYLQPVQWTNSFYPATCWKDADPCSRGFQCKVTDGLGAERTGMALQEPFYQMFAPWDDSYYYSPGSFWPSWGIPTDAQPGESWVPITLEYEDAPCPCF